jgi:DNA repair photolyase
MLKVLETEARSALARTSGFIAEAGFTHSLNPARNCTYGCTYCYVPTMRVYAGLQREDWERWGQFTTYKSNLSALLARELRPAQVIYCSPLVDPYQPVESGRRMMPDLLEVLAARPPALFVVQTRGPLITRDIELLRRIPRLRVSFSLTTNREEVRRRYEPHCAPWDDRLAAMRELVAAGIDVYATLAPLLPCDLEELVAAACAVTPRPLIADPLHIRETKRHGATSREAALRVAEHHGEEEWFRAEFQTKLVERLRAAAAAHDREIGVGAPGFSALTRPD